MAQPQDAVASQNRVITSIPKGTLSIAAIYQLELQYLLTSSSPQCECSQPWMPDLQAASHSAGSTALRVQLRRQLYAMLPCTALL